MNASDRPLWRRLTAVVVALIAAAGIAPRLGADTLVFHPRYGTAPKAWEKIAYYVDSRLFGTAPEVIAATTLNPGPVQWDPATKTLLLRKDFDDWPNVLDLAALGAADRAFLSQLLDALLKHAPDAAAVKARVLAATDAGERVVLGRDFITLVQREYRSYFDVHFALLIFLDDREAFEVKANEYPELGTLLDQHVDRLNLMFANQFAADAEWHLCLRGNLDRTRYDAMVIRERQPNRFVLERVDCDCRENAATPPVPGGPFVPDIPEKPPGCPPPVIELIKKPPQRPPWQPPIQPPGGNVHPPIGPGNRPARLLPGADNDLVAPGPPPQRRDPEDPPDQPGPDWLDQQAWEEQPDQAVLDELKASTDVTVDETYAEINRWIAEERDAWDVWNQQFAGRYVKGQVEAFERRLLMGDFEFSDGSKPDPEALVIERLRAIADRLGGTVEFEEREDLNRDPFQSPRITVTLPCSEDCASGAYDNAEYLRLRDALEAELAALAAEKDQVRGEIDALLALYPHIGAMTDPGAPWEGLLGCGVRLPGSTVSIGFGFGIEGWDLTTFFHNYLAPLLYNSKLSFRECCELAAKMYAMEAFVGAGGVPNFSEVLADVDGFCDQWVAAANASGGANRAAAQQVILVLRPYCETLRQAYIEAFEEKEFEGGRLTADQIRIVVDRREGMTQAERDARDMIDDHRILTKYLNLLCAYVRTALAELDCQRAECIRQFRERCFDPKKCIDFAIHMLAKSYCQFAESARASGGRSWEFAEAELHCNCEAYEEILKNFEQYPPGFVNFILCLKQRYCPEPSDPPRTVELQVESAGPGAVSVSPDGPYHAGDEITVEALPAPDAIFEGWGDPIRGEESAKTFVLEDDARITGFFAQLVAAEIVPAEGGAVTGAYVGGTPVPAGSQVLLQAEPAAGFYVAGWQIGSRIDRAHRLILPMDGTQIVAPIFLPVSGAVDASASLTPLGFGGDGSLRFQATGLSGTLWDLEISTNAARWSRTGEKIRLGEGMGDGSVHPGTATEFFLRLSAEAPTGEELLLLLEGD